MYFTILGQDLSDNVLKPNNFGFQDSVSIVYIVCGKYHALALDNKGNVYSWGSNRFGQLGHAQSHDDCETLKYPTLVKCIAEEVKI
jgi:alpha-tubulin suppressor-like RCC1 family protein